MSTVTGLLFTSLRGHGGSSPLVLKNRISSTITWGLVASQAKMESIFILFYLFPALKDSIKRFILTTWSESPPLNRAKATNPRIASLVSVFPTSLTHSLASLRPCTFTFVQGEFIIPIFSRTVILGNYCIKYFFLNIFGSICYQVLVIFIDIHYMALFPGTTLLSNWSLFSSLY